MSELPRTGLYRDAVGGLFLMEQGDHRVLRIPEDGHSPVFYDDYRPAFPVTTAQGVSVTFTED